MKIGSSFDTKLKRTLIKQYTQQYGTKDTIIISRATRYLVFYCIAPTIALLTWIIILIFLGGFDINTSSIDWIRDFLVRFAAIASILVWWYYIIGQFINYYMDFCITTPNEIVFYTQYGLFHRKSKIAKTEDIKVVTVDGSGFRRSLLDYGDISIFFEWTYTQAQASNPWSINMSFVSDVERVKNRIKKLLDLTTAVEHRKHD